jgi:hypothetical protein
MRSPMRSHFGLAAFMILGVLVGMSVQAQETSSGSDVGNIIKRYALKQGAGVRYEDDATHYTARLFIDRHQPQALITFTEPVTGPRVLEITSVELRGHVALVRRFFDVGGDGTVDHTVSASGATLGNAYRALTGARPQPATENDQTRYGNFIELVVHPTDQRQ